MSNGHSVGQERLHDKVISKFARKKREETFQNAPFHILYSSFYTVREIFKRWEGVE